MGLFNPDAALMQLIQEDEELTGLLKAKLKDAIVGMRTEELTQSLEGSVNTYFESLDLYEWDDIAEHIALKVQEVVEQIFSGLNLSVNITPKAEVIAGAGELGAIQAAPDEDAF